MKIVGVALVVYKRSWNVKEEGLGVIKLVHSWIDLANWVRELGFLKGKAIVSIDDSDNGSGIALDIQHNKAIKNVYITESFLSVKCMNYLLCFLVILFYRYGAIGLIFAPNNHVVGVMVDLKLLV